MASDTMRTWRNQLYFGPIPGIMPIRTFENELRSAEIHTVVCLNPPAEIEHLSPEYARWRERVRARGGIDTAEGDGTVSKRDSAVSPGEPGRAPDGAVREAGSPTWEVPPYPLTLVDIPIEDYRVPSAGIAPLFRREAEAQEAFLLTCT